MPAEVLEALEIEATQCTDLSRLLEIGREREALQAQLVCSANVERLAAEAEAERRAARRRAESEAWKIERARLLAEHDAQSMLVLQCARATGRAWRRLREIGTSMRGEAPALFVIEPAAREVERLALAGQELGDEILARILLHGW